MGGLWVDYNLESTIPGLFVAGEANFSDHGANRLGASALMQGLADGYFVLPATLSDYLARTKLERMDATHPAVTETRQDVDQRIHHLVNIKGKHTPDWFHRQLGHIMWDNCGMGRNEAGLKHALDQIPALREQFWQDVNVPGTNQEVNQSLENAGRVADFLELGELMCRDALHRNESCGGHFREESQTEEGEALRDDENFSYVAAWEHAGVNQPPILHREELEFEYVHPSQRSYK
jgi:succinate dehydrogenase / fumarate reductase flavoprotein subunit